MASEADRRLQVFVVHGRNAVARDAMFAFLRRIGLRPIEFEQAAAATGAAPYIGEVLNTAFAMAQAVVVLMTPDEVAYLRTEYAESAAETAPQTQARPNVLFEAGMALGFHPNRTVLVELGKLRSFSDVAGRHSIRNITTVQGLKALTDRLQAAGCDVDTSGAHWLDADQFSEPPSADGDMPLGKRVVAGAGPVRAAVDARYHSRGRGNGTLEVSNLCGQDLLGLSVEYVPDDDANGRHELRVNDRGLPIKRLPSGKSASVNAYKLGAMNHATVLITATMEDGTPVREDVFVNLS
jgi:hypothetical protein